MIGDAVSAHSVKVSYLGPDARHLGVDEQWLPTLFFCLTGGLSLFCGNFYGVLRKRQKEGGVPLILQILMASLVLMLCSLVLEQLHLYSLEASGSGINFFDELSHLLSWLSNAVLTVTFTMIAHGWTTTSPRPLEVLAFEGHGGLGPGSSALLRHF